MSLAAPDIVERLQDLPTGTFDAQSGGRRYIATKSTFAEGRAIKLVAEERGGPDYISLNLYVLDAGARLYPCEMPVAKVVAFVRDLTVDPSLPANCGLSS